MKKIKNGLTKLAVKGIMWKAKAKAAVSNTRGEGSVSTAITILISVVLGALLLAGLYYLMDEVVLPMVTDEVRDMFNYSG